MECVRLVSVPAGSDVWMFSIRPLRVWARHVASGAIKQTLAGRPGFEPGFHAPKACVLPLDDLPATRAKRSRVPAAWQRKQKAAILTPAECSGLKYSPLPRNAFGCSNQFSGGIEDSVDGRAAAGQRCGFGSGPDELVLKIAQFWPLRENDTLKIVFGRSPFLQGKLWPHAEKLHFTVFFASCQ